MILLIGASVYKMCADNWGEDPKTLSADPNFKKLIDATLNKFRQKSPSVMTVKPKQLALICLDQGEQFDEVADKLGKAFRNLRLAFETAFTIHIDHFRHCD